MFGCERMAGLELVLLARICASGSTDRVDYAVANPEPAMLLASSYPHDDFSINGLRARIEHRPMNLCWHRVVLTEAVVDGRIAERFRGAFGL